MFASRALIAEGVAPKPSSRVTATAGAATSAISTRPHHPVATATLSASACGAVRGGVGLGSGTRLGWGASTRRRHCRGNGTVSSSTRRKGGVAVYALFGPPPNPEVLLEEGKALYASGERMQGYKKFEKALNADDLKLETRQELLYCCMCCNAAFGDVETAKQFLRDMNLAGLPFEIAMLDARLMRMESSAQLRNQLKKFAAGELKSQGTVQREIFESTRVSEGGSVGAPGAQKPQKMGDMDLMNLDISGDTSAEVGAIATRVVGLVVLSIVGFVGLFQAGLQFL